MGDVPISVSRPHMPNYGIAPAEGGEGLLPWEWAQARLRDSHNYWLSTVTAAGLPHTRPVWGVWHGGGLVFSSDRGSLKVRNLVRQARCTVTTESAAEAVIVEGSAVVLVAPSDIEAAGADYLAKYGMGLVADSAIIRVVPTTVFAFVERDERFTGTATRWRFAPVSA